MFSPHLSTRRPLAASVVLALVLALAAAANAGARPFPEDEASEPPAAHPVSVADATSGIVTWDIVLVVMATVAILTIAIGAALLLRDKHREQTA